jgi:hypothetical protein
MKTIYTLSSPKILVFLLLMVCFVFPINNYAQNPVTKAMNASFQNRWTNNFLANGAGTAILSPANSNTWVVMPVPSVPECVYIKLANEELYLNTENGLGITAVSPGWHSAMWKIRKMEGTEYYQLINYWKGQPLNNETQKLEVSPAQDGYFSAMWVMNLSEIASNNPSNNIAYIIDDPAVANENYTISNPYILVEEAADGGTDPAIYGMINLRLMKNDKVEKTWNLFNRTEASGSRVIAPQSKAVVLLIPDNIISINPNEAEQYSLSLEAHLFDYDQNSGNDLLGNSGSTLPFTEAFDAPKEVVLNFNGEGKVKIAATLKRTASTGFMKIDETLITGDAYSAEEDPAPWIYTATKNWMGALSDNVKLKDVSIPGTHDAGSRFGGAAAETQTWTIKEQLNSGIRYLDIRCRRVGDKFAIHHGSVYQNQNFDDVMTEVKDFLRDNPKEVVVMRIKNETDSAAGSSTFREIWNGYLNNYPNLFYSSNYSDASLGAVRGKVFVLCQVPSACSNNGTSYYSIDVQDKYDVRWLAHEKEGDEYATLPSKKKLINNYIDKAASAPGWILNHLSGSTGMIPSDVARATNRSAYEYLGNNSGKRKLGILSMDFPGEQLIYRIIKSNFD